MIIINTQGTGEQGNHASLSQTLRGTLLNSRQVLESYPNMVFLFDENQCFVGCNKACEPLLGSVDRASLDGSSFHEIFAPSNNTWSEKAHKQHQLVFKTLCTESYENSVSLKNGQTMECRITISPFMTDGACLGTIMILDDITELVKLRRDPKDAARTKINFLANMSHEIRTPINAIKGLSELLALTKLDNMQVNYAHNIVASTNTLLSIINDILDFSKLDSSTIELIEGDYSLADLITEISNVVSFRAAEKGLLLFWDISPKLPRTLKGDDVRIKQIMLNVLGNAVKYTPKGRVLFKLYGEGNSVNGLIDLICVVEDTGVGIKEEELLGLFDPFYRADINSNRSILGPGLGLAISQKLANNMGGSISAKSEYGKGSVFTIRLPMGIADSSPLAFVADAEQKNVLLPGNVERLQYTANMLEKLQVKYTITTADKLDTLDLSQFTHCIYDDDDDSNVIRRIRTKMPACLFTVIKDMRYAMNQTEDYDAVLFMPILITELAKLLERKLASPGEERSIDTFALSDTRVLVVDDNEINLLVSGEILRTYKAEVTCSESGMEALNLCEKTVFDMIFMDHMMPGMDGIETTTEIRRRDGPNKNTPIIALTANVIDDMKDSYIECGMNDFIGKPIEISELSRVLRKFLPAKKIVSMQNALASKPAAGEKDEQPVKPAMEQLIASMDAFGMYVSDVMREIHSDYTLYLKRMERIRTHLSPLVLKLREEVAAQSWDAFAVDINELASMIHDAGARDCSGRARKLCRAAKEHNADYILGDFFSLMDNMYMLQKKMEVAVPIARGTLGVETPFGDKHFCLGLLGDMHGALTARNLGTAENLMESLACYSLDHDLDMILNDIRAQLAASNIDEALVINAKALEHCAASIS